MTILALALAVAAAEPIAACHSDTAVLTVVLEGIEVDVGDGFSLRRLWSGPEGEETSPRVVVATGTVVDESLGRVEFQLTVGEVWSLRRGGEDATLRVPKAFRKPGEARILGVGRTHVWLAAPGGLARVSLADSTVETARAGKRSSTAQPLTIGERALVVVGNDLLDCSTPASCERRARLPAPISQVGGGRGGWLLVATGKQGGLYRAPRSMPEAATPLIEGEVVALCATEGVDAWAVVEVDDEVRVVAAATDTPAVRSFSAGEIFNRGLVGTSDPVVIARVLEVAAEKRWPELEQMALALIDDERDEVRGLAAAALGRVPGARATAALWPVSYTHLRAHETADVISYAVF